MRDECNQNDCFFPYYLIILDISDNGNEALERWMVLLEFSTNDKLLAES